MDYSLLKDPLEWKFSCGSIGIRLKRYWVINLIAALLHGVNALLMVILYYANDKHDQLYDLTTQYGTWERTNDTMRVFTAETTVITGWSLNWTIFAFHFLSFAFQLAVYLPPYKYQERVEEPEINGNHYLRFVEYSISAGIMLICIALLCGVRDFILLLSIFLFTAVTQVLGGICEYMKAGVLRTMTHLTAWVSIFAAYGIIIWYYLTAIVMNNVSPPDFVHAIVITQMLLFMSFGFVQLLQFYGKSWRFVGAIGRQPEISYTILSLVAKTLLGWLIYSNLIVTASQ